MAEFDLVATTLYGLEHLLAKELSDIGASDIVVLNRAVTFKGDQAILYKCNLLLRTAVKILKPIRSFKAKNEEELYYGVKKIPWYDYFDFNATFAIDGSTHGEIFTHSKFIALKSKDAIADLFREKYGLRPSVDTEHPDVRINVHIAHDVVTVSLDSSGNILSKRNYRLNQTEASMNEVLAAGIILLTGWDKQSDFVDPMCGSGTLAIEAALMACNIPAGRNRNMGFETWKDFDKALWEQIKAEANAKIKSADCSIYAHDIDEKALKVATTNASRAGVKAQISFDIVDFFESEYNGDKATVVINPPYGERIEVFDISEFYKDMGTRLKHFYPGCEAWVISSNIEAIKHFGLRPTRRIKLFNGPLECRLHKYVLYKGSKRDMYGGEEE